MTVAAVTEVQKALHEMLQRIPVLEANLEHSHRQHRAIVHAVLGGDTARARQTMEEHCDDTAALLRGLLG
jgi:GntR family transcriptional regulator, transcriptional repressor for pyruvate dehydrogenase complex